MNPSFKPFAPDIDIYHLLQGSQIYYFLRELTGWLFAFGIAIFIVAILISAILFALSGGNLRMVERSRFWLELGVIIVIITGLVWAIFNIIKRIFNV